MKEENIQNYCLTCNRDTWHEVNGSHSLVSPPEVYHCEIIHLLVKCKGCDTVSFRKEEHDYESAYPTEDDEWEVPIIVENYPKKSKGTISTRHLPDIVESIYKETCNAYRDGALTLAGIGFRATIEAICNDLDVAGKELSTRINNLASKGLISKRDSTRLHAIRFLGNDAAHEIITPKKNALDAALIIVEHLLTTVYILDKEANGKLEEVIEEYEKFETLLNKKLSSFSSGDEYPLQKYLGKEMRLLSGSIKALESTLNEKIGKGEYSALIFGKKDKYLDSKEDLQHYKVT